MITKVIKMPPPLILTKENTNIILMHEQRSSQNLQRLETSLSQFVTVE